jgi:protochlorophyllide reductase
MSPRWTTADIPDLTGRTALVTGANAGLGLEIARGLSGAGARVLLACRNLEKAEAAAADIAGPGPVEVRKLDLASLASVRALATEVLAGEDRLDLLVNNAGLMATDESTTEDGFEMQIGVNHLGHFVLTAELLPLLLATPGSRVGSMSSFGHRPGRLHVDDLMFERRRYQRWLAYFQSKLANLLFTAELQRRLAEAGASTIAVAAHPGASRTDLGFEGSGLFNKLLPGGIALAQPASVGALPMLRAMTDPTVAGGELYGPRFVFRGKAAVRETPSKRARNAEDARALWAESERLTGASIDAALADAPTT